MESTRDDSLGLYGFNQFTAFISHELLLDFW
jgi:hypothetical protein